MNAEDRFKEKFENVRNVELHIIRKRRERIREELNCGDQGPDADHSLVGLALSGGGIRSAITNLGVLQGLASLGILRMIDLLSTVSGGGYIGGCLSTLLSVKRPQADKGVAGDDVYMFRDKLVANWYW